MTIWFTSDTHFGHHRIIELCDRPFDNVDHMNSVIVNNFNEVIQPDDTLVHLGDVALGSISDSLPVVSRINGRKILVPGNHDRVGTPMSKPGSEKRERWMAEYSKVFHRIFDEVHEIAITMSETEHHFDFSLILSSHYPYDGDSHGEDRWTDIRPVDEGVPLIHGHTHMPTQRAHLSKKGTPMFHVGVDAWNYRPVHEDVIKEWLNEVR